MIIKLIKHLIVYLLSCVVAAELFFIFESLFTQSTFKIDILLFTAVIGSVFALQFSFVGYLCVFLLAYFLKLKNPCLYIVLGGFTIPISAIFLGTLLDNMSISAALNSIPFNKNGAIVLSSATAALFYWWLENKWINKSKPNTKNLEA